MNYYCMYTIYMYIFFAFPLPLEQRDVRAHHLSTHRSISVHSHVYTHVSRISSCISFFVHCPDQLCIGTAVKTGWKYRNWDWLGDLDAWCSTAYLAGLSRWLIIIGRMYMVKYNLEARVVEGNRGGQWRSFCFPVVNSIEG